MRRTAAVVASLLVGSLLVWIGPPGASAGASQPQPPRTRLSLSAQTSAVVPGGDFTLRLRVDRANLPASAELAVTVFRSVRTRSEFVETVQDRIARPAVAPATVFPVASLPVDSTGEVTVRIPLQDPNQPAEPGRIDLDVDEGVFPVRVDLRARGGNSLERFVTHLMQFSAGRGDTKLGMALVLPLYASTGLPADGPRELEGLDEILGVAQALEATRSLPFSVQLSPETVATLASSSEEEAAQTLESLRRVAVDHPVLAAPYVPISLPGLLAADLEDEVEIQLTKGIAVVGDALRTRPEIRTWNATEPLDPLSVDYLVERGVERILAPDAALEAVDDLSVTLARPFALGGEEADVPAAVTDGGLTAHFNDSANQVLQAHHLLADLAVLWMDAPGDTRRAVVAAAPREWRANRPFLEALAGGLAQSPVTEALSLDTLFSSAEPALTDRGTPLVRQPAAVIAAAAVLGDVVADVRQARRRLTSLGSILGPALPASQLMEERLLVAQSSDLRATRQRQAYLNAVETGIADQLEAIQMPQGASITLTDRRGQIPVTFQNRTGSPARVVVKVQSDKLEFPEGDTRPLDLARRNTTERFTVVARTSGAFPLRITMTSPDGNLVVGGGRLTVRSTAASRVSLFVSAGAALFLALWWGQHVVRGRRARRLVPS
ncbi:MAG: DUF6049 family protein [Actinobacteria bacterium]|nr:DUF6049 family protein [Actinomycetota bacterium]